MGVAAQVSAWSLHVDVLPRVAYPRRCRRCQSHAKFPLFPVATSMPLEGRDYFYIMAGFWTLPAPEIPTVVPTENNSWSSVKSLYQ